MSVPASEVVAPRARWLTGRRKAVLGLLSLVVLVELVVFRRPLFEGNLGAVGEPGRVYRSAQPGSGLADLARERHLASILNLRGGSLADSWYANEVRVTHDLGVTFYDFPMSATQRPSRRELLTLLDVFDRGPYPMLIHCKSGSDRTGLASALYLLYVERKATEEASRAFSVSYGHFPVFGTKRLHEPIDEYGQWLTARGLKHDPSRFRKWVEQEYEDPSGSRFTPLQPGPRMQAGPRLGRTVPVGTP